MVGWMKLALLLMPVLVEGGETACADSECTKHGDDIELLQQRLDHRFHGSVNEGGRRSRRRRRPTPGQSVKCPLGNGECAGNQCCPASDRSDGLTYPCPSADEGWDGCEESLCLFSDNACVGNQCCPGSWETLNKTYPCPSADPFWNDCEYKGGGPYTINLIDVNEGGRRRRRRRRPTPGQSVQCPLGDGECAGNQCCPASNSSGGLTYPCPSADEGWDGCEESLCYFSDTACKGNQCCPRSQFTGNQTYPCPSADSDFKGCEYNGPPPPL